MAGRDRAPLPTDASGLPPLGPAYDEALRLGLSRLGIGLPDPVLAAFGAHARLLLAWDAAINLTAIRAPADVARRHVLDSLTALPVLRERCPAGPWLLDIGSGGGYPGLPLAVALPAGHAMMVESVGKKARFLAVAAAAVAAAAEAGGAPVPLIVVEAVRAEALGDPHRARWDAVTARAVGSLAEIAELGLPLVRRGGWLVCWKRQDHEGRLRAELASAAQSVRDLGGAPAEVRDDPETILPGHRLVVIEKVRPTPGRYPRPAAERRRALLR